MQQHSEKENSSEGKSDNKG